MTEEWRDVPGLEGKIQVSNLGRVRTLRIQACGVSSHGYRRACTGMETNRYVHDLVAHAFIGPKPEGLQVNHIDGNKLNNQPENLEYVTPRQNYQHAFRTGLAVRTLTDEQMTAISHEFFDEGRSVMEISRKYKTHRNVIRSVVHLWTAKDRKGRRNPYEHKLDEARAYQALCMYKAGGVNQSQVAAAFGCHPAHISRVVNGIIWPSALARYNRENQVEVSK
jgi:hypothetical protein